MSPEALRPAIDTVATACRVARAVQRDLERVKQITKDDRSPVTVADYAVQAVIALALRESAGDDVLIVGEEHAGFLRNPEHDALRAQVVEAVRMVYPDLDGDAVLDAIDACDHDASADAYWTLDPIDGTKGFLRGQQYAIALARIESGQVVLGVMGCPNLPLDFSRPFDEPDPKGAIYASAIGGGCWQWAGEEIRDAPKAVHVRPSDDPGTIVRLCESVEAAHSRRSDAARVSAHLGLSIEYTRLDSQCKYGVVARGQADAYLRMPTRKDYVEKIWDHAAGMLIATEAGAVVTDITGSPLDFSRGRRLEANRGVVCAGAAIHPMIIGAIEELGISAAV